MQILTNHVNKYGLDWLTFGFASTFLGFYIILLPHPVVNDYLKLRGLFLETPLKRLVLQHFRHQCNVIVRFNGMGCASCIRLDMKTDVLICAILCNVMQSTYGGPPVLRLPLGNGKPGHIGEVAIHEGHITYIQRIVVHKRGDLW